MEIKHLFIIDPWEKIHFESDTSVLLMNESLRQGHKVFSCTEFDIWARNGERFCRVIDHKSPINQEVKNRALHKNPSSLEGFDIIHIRKDPPFDELYVALLLTLRRLRHPLIINNPDALLLNNEKMSILMFQDLIADTLVSSSPQEIIKFVKSTGGCAVLKPLFSCSGKGVDLIEAEDPLIEKKLIERTSDGKVKVMVQKFLPAIKEGETRIFMLEDKPLAVMKKIPAKGSFKANFNSGARGEAYELNKKEEEICARIGEFCRKNGIILSALDIINSKISEINITSPGLLIETGAVNGKNYEKDVIKFLCKKLS